MLRNEIPLSFHGSVNQIWTVCCMLRNFMTPLIQKDMESGWFILSNTGPYTELISLIRDDCWTTRSTILCDRIVDTQKNFFFSYQEYWHVHQRKEIGDVVKRSINFNNKWCCCKCNDIQYCFGLNIWTFSFFFYLKFVIGKKFL